MTSSILFPLILLFKGKPPLFAQPALVAGGRRHGVSLGAGLLRKSSSGSAQSPARFCPRASQTGGSEAFANPLLPTHVPWLVEET